MTTIDRKRPETAASSDTASEAAPTEGLSARERALEKLRQLRDSDEQARKDRDERDAEAYLPKLEGLKSEPIIVEFPKAPPEVVGTVVLRRATDIEVKVLNQHLNGKGSTQDKEEFAYKFTFGCLIWPSKEELKALYKAVPLADGKVTTALIDAAKGGSDKGKE